jgi:tetratricopeptide (TPR) repeat protein/membrane associated rhomboid family serine protease
MDRRPTLVLFDPRIFVTMTIIVINFSVLVGMELAGGSTNPQVLLRFGAKFNPLIWHGEWWRLFTMMFLHIGFIHFFFNSYALFVLGWAVEPCIGRVRYVALYLLSGISGSLLSTIFSATTISAGASGAIFGVAGAALAGELVRGASFATILRRPYSRGLILFIVVTLAFGFLVRFIDNSAHIGGAIAGFCLGYVFFAHRAKLPLLVARSRIFLWAFILGFSAAVVLFFHPPKTWQWRYAHALYSMYTDNYEAARSELLSVVKHRPDFAPAHSLLAEIYSRFHDYERAVQELRIANRLDPRNDETELSLGEAYFTLGNYSQALPHVNKSLALGPKTNSKFFLLGLCLEKLNQPIQALQAYKEALKLDPAERVLFYAYVRRILTSHAFGSYQEALDAFNSAMATMPQNFDYFLIRGNIHKVYRHFNDAIEDFRKALDINQSALIAHYQIAYCYKGMGAYDKALNAIQSFLDQTSGKEYLSDLALDGLMLRSKIYQTLGRSTDAARDNELIEHMYQSLLAQSPDPMIQNNLAWHYATTNTKLDGAITLAQQAVEAEREPTYLDTHGWLYYKTGRYEDALPLFREALERDPDNAQTYLYHLGATLYKLGRIAEAREALRKATEPGLDFDEYEQAAALLQEIKTGI